PRYLLQLPVVKVMVV
nr:beta 2m- class I-binding peptide=major histocompatibility complex H-2Kb-specific molecule poorly associated with beta 2-microglobulin [mice, NSO plasmacytoma cell line, Kb-high cells, Peptide Partial, 15 aa] [Mus sp.]